MLVSAKLNKAAANRFLLIEPLFNFPNGATNRGEGSLWGQASNGVIRRDQREQKVITVPGIEGTKRENGIIGAQ